MERINQIGDIYNRETVSKYYDNRDAYEKTNMADVLLVRLIPLRLDGKVVLDVGCGDGRHSALLYRRGPKRVIAMDLSPSMLERVQARKDKFGLERLDVVQADIDHLQLDKDEVDFIFSRFSLMYSKNLGEAVKGLGETLKAGGEAVIEASVAEVNDPAELKNIKDAPVPLKLRIVDKSVDIKNYAYTQEDYLAAFRDAGLHVEIQERFPTDDLSVAEDYAHKDSVRFDYIVFKLKKIEGNA
jgi:ubiquinone/menaquinone biosynthesis C-methylase UbiE